MSLPNGKKLSLSPQKPLEQVEANEQQRIAELKAAAEALPEQVKRLPEKGATNKPVVITNEIRTVIEKMIPISRTQALEESVAGTNWHQLSRVRPARGADDSIRNQIPTRLSATLEDSTAKERPRPTVSPGKQSLTSLRATNPGPSNVITTTNPAMAIDFHRIAPSHEAPVPRKPPVVGRGLQVNRKPKSDRRNPAKEDLEWGQADQMLTVSSPLALMLVLFALIGLVRLGRRLYEVTLAEIGDDGAAIPITLKVQGRTERIILGLLEPRVEPVDLRCEFPAAISLGFFGRIAISPGRARVIIGGIPLETSTAPLRLGDQIQIHIQSDAKHSFRGRSGFGAR